MKCEYVTNEAIRRSLTPMNNSEPKNYLIHWSVAFIIAIAFEIFAWVQYIHPFFWSEGIAYTELAWGMYVMGICYLMIDMGILYKIIENYLKNWR